MDADAAPHVRRAAGPARAGGPDAVALIDRGPDGAAIPLTAAELAARVAALTNELGERGIAAGDCVAVWLPNWSDALVWQFAVAARGAHVVGVNTRYDVAEVDARARQGAPAAGRAADRFHDLDLPGRLHEAVPG